MEERRREYGVALANRRIASPWLLNFTCVELWQGGKHSAALRRYIIWLWLRRKKIYAVHIKQCSPTVDICRCKYRVIYNAICHLHYQYFSLEKRKVVLKADTRSKQCSTVKMISTLKAEAQMHLSLTTEIHTRPEKLNHKSSETYCPAITSYNMRPLLNIFYLHKHVQMPSS